MASQQNPLSIYGTDQEKISMALNSQKKTVDPEDLLVHTMKGDLEMSANGNAGATSVRKSMTDEKILTERQKNSPFLSASQEKTPVPAEKDAPIAPEDIAVRPRSYEIKPESPKKQSSIIMAPDGSKKINWFLTITIFSSILFIAGGAYLWTLTGNKSVTTVQEPGMEMPVENSASSEQNMNVPENATIVLSDSQTNYMQLDFDNTEAKSILDQLGKYVELVRNGNYAAPIEFNVTDMKNNPIPVDMFLDKMDIGLTPAIRAQLGTEYSIFIFNDSGNTRLGLEISSKNDAKLQEELSKEEPSLVKYVRPLLLGLILPPTNSPFSSSSYLGASIRYINFNIGDDISIDYTVFGNQLIIGTSKTTLRSILDFKNKISLPSGQ